MLSTLENQEIRNLKLIHSLSLFFFRVVQVEGGAAGEEAEAEVAVHARSHPHLLHSQEIPEAASSLVWSCKLRRKQQERRRNSELLTFYLSFFVFLCLSLSLFVFSLSYLCHPM